ncbi:MAG: ParB N-terminal domain-containing protein [Planctomycetaceae bacterium]
MDRSAKIKLREEQGVTPAVQTGGPLYEILDGVRRAKAAHLTGCSTIPAQLFDAAGKLICEFDVPIDQLRSPHKDSIRRVTPADNARWQRVWQGAQQPSLSFPPILITTGSRGLKVEDLIFDFGGAP